VLIGPHFERHDLQSDLEVRKRANLINSGRPPALGCFFAHSNQTTLIFGLRGFCITFVDGWIVETIN
jgi:hypothetical protein